jgi:hypothetical protein
LGAVSNSAVPISALLLMSRADFGIFSIVYLIFALGWSMTLSVVCDAWARTRSSLRQEDERDTFRWVQLQLALITGAAGGAVAGAMFNDAWTGLACGVAILATLYRTGSRYQETVLGGTVRALSSDATTVGSLVAALTLFRWLDLDWGVAIVVSWVISGLAGASFFSLQPSSAAYGLIGWIRARRETIKPLLGDSVLMDAGAAWAPLAMAPFMSVTSFALYRGVSSVATPVQFILDPLRPALSLLPPHRTSKGRAALAVMLAGSFMAGACWCALVLVVNPFKIGGETLIGLTSFALPVSLFVLANFVGHFYYIAARSHASHRRLLQGRIFQTAVTGIFPFVGLATGALAGAIWALAAATLCSSLVWLGLARMVARDDAVQLVRSSPKAG